MKKVIILMSVVILFTIGNIYATTVLTFDDVTVPGNTWTTLPTNYAGFNWDPNWEVTTNSFFNNMYGNTVTFPSASNAIYNGYGVLSITTQNSQPFLFHGAYVLPWLFNNGMSNSQTATSITVKGYLNNVLVGSTYLGLTPSFQWLSPSFSSSWVDKLEFISSGNQQWYIMDNFTYTPIPEPASLLLLGIGLSAIGGMGLLRRRKV